MKIFYCVKSLDGIPSCMYNIQLIHELGYEIIPILGSASKELVADLKKMNITFELLEKPDDKKCERKYKKIFKFLKYRKFVKSIVKERSNKEDIVFIGTGDTAIALYDALKRQKKVLVLKELYDIPKYYQVVLRKMSSNMTAIICCEKNRSRIIKFRWNLKQLPYTMPNKPIGHPRQKHLEPSSTLTKKIVNDIKGNKIILYQARHIHFVPELQQLAHALAGLKDTYLLVLVGTVDDEEEIKKVIDIYPNVYLTGHIPAPLHMEVTSYADIGVAVYQENSLNNLFCAPNKIYEYAGFGIPTIGNDIPGLVDTIQRFEAGECVQWDDVCAIEGAIQKIYQNYDEYDKRATNFYDQTDCYNIMERVINDIQSMGV